MKINKLLLLIFLFAILSLPSILIVSDIVFKKLTRYFKKQLDTGGVNCKCGSSSCDDPSNHKNGLIPSHYRGFLSNGATLKCDECHTNPAFIIVAGKRKCIQCK